MKNRITLIILSLVVVSSAAFGQTSGRSSRVELSASNTDYRQSDGGLIFPTIDSLEATNGQAVGRSFSYDSTGLDQNGDTQTMSISGSAIAQGDYGFLRTSAQGSLQNAFYNPANEPFYDSLTETAGNPGVPDVLNLFGFASWTDSLRVGSTATNYYSTWIFNITGNNSGDSAFAFTSFRSRIGNNPSEGFFFGDTGPISTIVRVSQYIQGNTPESVNFTLFSAFQPQTQLISGGATATGMSNFSNTVRLTGIEIRESPTGPILNNVSITSDSGFQYSVVPEPASMTILGLGLIAMLKKRKKA